MRTTNRLARESSPYLKQHAHNPVDWYAWGDEAFAIAKERNCPIFLSIGYSTCHWCHVMAHESFEDPATADLLNRRFVSIKVDREERPDIDSTYMSAVQAMGVRGGWPLSVFLTPDGKPFYGGTYFPSREGRGMPSFTRVLESVADAWHERQQEIVESAEAISTQLQGDPLAEAAESQVSELLLSGAAESLEQEFDQTSGGFGQSPKFPQPMLLEFLLHTWFRTGEDKWLNMVVRSLGKMRQGGIYDQLGGGFHRYATDERWLIPHFEKMLYDNAQLALVYLHAYQATQTTSYRAVCEETLNYLLREMRLSSGGFASAQDADSEGEEGKYYVWEYDEFVDTLEGTEGRTAALYFDVTAGGNFDGKNIPHIARDLDVVAAMAKVPEEDVLPIVERAKDKLLAVRERRIHPSRDDKVIVSWNGMVLRALAEASAVLECTEYRTAAIELATFLLGHARVHGQLMHTAVNGPASVPAYLEDVASLTDGLVALYEATFDEQWIREAIGLTELIIQDYSDADGSGFFDATDAHKTPLRKPRDLTDSATPAGSSVVADVLLRLAAILQQPELEVRAGKYLSRMVTTVRQYPSAFGRLLCAFDFYLSSPKEIAIIGDPSEAATRELVRVAHQHYLPNRVIASGAPDAALRDSTVVGLLSGRALVGGKPTAFVCEHFVCLAPVTTPEELSLLLSKHEDEIWQDA